MGHAIPVDLTAVVQEQTDACLAVYREDRSRIEQDANNELRISEGGYGRRQIHELVQNAIDAARTDGGSRLEVAVTDDHLYVANDGAPFSEAGIRAVMASDLSRKEGESIGRFGIGFKSVLAVSDAPSIYSRTVSFGFDATFARDLIEGAGFQAPGYPVMRLAKILDWDEASRRDAVLAELSQWAATVIVLPLKTPSIPLVAQLSAFPSEFMLFSPHMNRAVFRFIGADGRTSERVIQASRSGDRSIRLTRDGASEDWTVATLVHRVSDAAMQDAGRIAGRQTVELSWAVPMGKRSRLGEFWAFLPTMAKTTLAGIINAPWKLTDDRTDLLDSEFNRELLVRALPRLVSTNLDLWEKHDATGSLLDIYPSRALEDRGWADRILNEPVTAALKRCSSLPDGTGRLRLPSELKLFPENLQASWLDEWAESGGAPLSDWVHVSTEATPERRAKARRLMGGEGKAAATVTEWLEALTEREPVLGAAAAIRLAAAIFRSSMRPNSTRDTHAEVSAARILLLEDGSFARPARGRVFIRGDDNESGELFVDAALAQEPGVRDALRTLGIEVLDRRGRLRSLLIAAQADPRTWSAVWPAARELVPTEAASIFGEELGDFPEGSILVRTVAGRNRPLSRVLLPGAVIPLGSTSDPEVLIDSRTHGMDFDLLRELGAVSEPTWRQRAAREEWRPLYEQSVTDLYLQEHKGLPLDRTDLRVTGDDPAWPLDVLALLSPQARIVFTNLVLRRGLPRRWKVANAARPTMPIMSVTSPTIWVLSRHGRFETPFGALRPDRCVLASDDLESAAAVLPIVDLAADTSEALGVKSQVEDLEPGDWRALKTSADTWQDDDKRHEFYSWLPGRIDVETLVVRVGRNREPVRIENIGVTADWGVYQSMIEAGVPALWVENQQDVDEQFIETWNMKDGKTLLEEEIVFTPSGEPIHLLDAYKPLGLQPALIDEPELMLQHCERIERLVATPKGQMARPMAQMREGNVVHVTAKADRVILQQISAALGLDLDAREIDKVIRQMEAGVARNLRRKVRKAIDQQTRLIEAVGVDALRRTLPANALEALERDGEVLSPRAVADLAISVHGIGILEVLKAELEERGLEPPREWAGRRVSRQFVADLGFPSEWAGFPSAPRDAVEVVDGPAVLHPLHDYQARVVENLRRLIRRETVSRGMLTLPTGAGKTRVTVEAVVRAVVAGELTANVLWIAQSDELCEQAVETWRHVWRALGPASPLSIGRLWGSNEVSEDPGVFQLIVATDEKLNSIAQRPGDDYEWLRTPELVIIDEAHTSISPTYTRIFEWIGGSRASSSDRRIVGLSATPYRGVNDVETQRLISRYSAHRLDHGVFEGSPYQRLQEMGVLARIMSSTIDGVKVELNDKEADEVEQLRRLPTAVEDRISRDVERNRKIVDSIAGLEEDWTVLLFASSVENARTLAAMLSHRKITAQPISAATPPAARKHYIEEFRHGRIRVLTNFNVLTQGFDAPAVRAVYVARPVFSPNVYLQMVGRGLRGPANGGSSEVAIFNVEDTFNRFGELLAFREFESGAWTR